MQVESTQISVQNPTSELSQYSQNLIQMPIAISTQASTSTQNVRESEDYSSLVSLIKDQSNLIESFKKIIEGLNAKLERFEKFEKSLVSKNIHENVHESVCENDCENQNVIQEQGNLHKNDILKPIFLQCKFIHDEIKHN